MTNQETLSFHGINGATGDYLLPPLSAPQISALARGEPFDPQTRQVWRWATWKVFDDPDHDTGIVCFITVAGFLNGPGFQRMREYLRRTADRIWVIYRKKTVSGRLSATAVRRRRSAKFNPTTGWPNIRPNCSTSCTFWRCSWNWSQPKRNFWRRSLLEAICGGPLLKFRP